MSRVCFVFWDGVGLGDDAPHNAFSFAAAPTLQQLVGGRWLAGHTARAPELHFDSLDASLGVAGLPQSATGQTALFTGVNAAAVVGMHISAYPTQALRDIIAEHSFLKQARAAGFVGTFANPFGPQYWQLVEERKLRLSASTLSMMASELPLRTFDDLASGRAVSWDITHELAGARYQAPVPARVTPQQSGAALARLSHEFALVFYETFLPDLTGHRRLPLASEEVVEMLDGLVEGFLETAPRDTTLVITSDHGNLEDTRTKGHTYHRVPLLAYGPGADYFRACRSLTDVTPAILACLCDGSGPGNEHREDSGRGLPAVNC